MLETMLARQPQDLRMLYIDMDSFFASAEQQRQPELRGRPVGVCPHVTPGGCVVAASREAKRYGVRTGMRVQEALSLAPDIVFVRDTPHYYRKLHAEIVKILEATLCRVIVRGVDEMGLVVPSYMRNPQQIESLCQEIKARLLVQLGEVLTGSIGVAANSWQAKMAASSQKPNGLVILPQSQQADFYKSLELMALTGINRRMRKRLYAIGIYSPLDLYRASEPFLRQSFGINGTKWYLRLRGFEVDDRPVKEKQSIGHQTTLMPRPAETYEQLRSVLVKMLLKVGYRLRATGRGAQGLAVTVGYLDHTYWSALVRHLSPTASHAGLITQVDRLISPLAKGFKPIKRVTITTFDLVHGAQQSWLEPLSNQDDRLSSALDELRRRFGAGAITTAAGLSADVFPDRIGFGAPEDLFLPRVD